MTTLDDSLMSMGQILGSPFVGPMQDKVKYWYELLILMQDTLKEWTACQRSWVYLESIFASPGIQRELSTDNAEFQKVDRGWKSIMQRAHDTDHAIELVRAPGLNLKETFRDYNDKLDKITKSLNRYLNTKRIAFPRFYFLSNEELLKILANAKDPRMVEPHLPKCFEAVHTLEFGGEGNRDIKAMRSPELEKNSFVDCGQGSSSCRGLVETVRKSHERYVEKAHASRCRCIGASTSWRMDYGKICSSGNDSLPNCMGSWL